MLVARDLRRDFGERHALAGVSMEVQAGEVVALLGPNGAGKSTLLQILAGILHADGGSATVAGAKLPGDEARLHEVVGFVPQGESVYPELTVEENLRFFARVHGVSGGKRVRERVAALLREVALTDRAASRAGDLSGGLRQRLAVACSLVHEPAVLLLDEPGTGLDPVARDRLAAIIRGHKDRGQAVLVTTHNIEEAARVADRVILLSRGRVAAVMPPTNVRAIEDRFRTLEAAR